MGKESVRLLCNCIVVKWSVLIEWMRESGEKKSVKEKCESV